MTSITGIRKSAVFPCVLALALTSAVAAPVQQAFSETVSVIVRSVSSADAGAALERHDGRSTMELPIIDGVAGEVPSSELPNLARDPRVRAISLNAPVSVQGKPDARGRTSATESTVTSSKGGGGGAPTIRPATAVYPYVVRADALWRQSIDGNRVTVGVIDTGIARVADLDGRLVGGVDLTEEGDPFRDSFGHGTFVAGIIAGNGAASGGKYKGVAPRANLVSIKIAGRNGASDVSHVLAALQWAVSFKDAYGIRALNLSLGTDSRQPYELSPLNLGVQRAWDAGIVVLVSASNSGPGAGTVTKPGDDPLVVTVGASDDMGTADRRDDKMADFSGRGPTASNGLNKPDIVAPGRSVLSLRAPGSAVDDAYPSARFGSAYFKGSGTSFSTAVATGATALMLQRQPGLTPDQVKHRLLHTAARGPARNANVDGYGALDAYAASTATTTASANKGVVRSFGLGTLEADRGSLQVAIHSQGLLGLPLLKLLTGELTAQDKLFLGLEYATAEWSVSRWYDSQWTGSRWYATDWYGSRWYGSRWYTTDWYGSRWYAIAWE